MGGGQNKGNFSWKTLIGDLTAFKNILLSLKHPYFYGCQLYRGIHGPARSLLPTSSVSPVQSFVLYFHLWKEHWITMQSHLCGCSCHFAKQTIYTRRVVNHSFGFQICWKWQWNHTQRPWWFFFLTMTKFDYFF